MMNDPIGIFDSGVGGTSIWKEIHQLLPMESTIYLADSKNAPYGERSKDEIIRLSVKNTEYLLGEGCKLIVVACNTATTNAIDYLRKNYDVPFIGIEPAIKPAALKSKTGVVGVLATRGTLASSLFSKTSDLYAKDREVIEQFGNGLVPLIEAGKIESAEMERLLHKYLQPMIDKNADYLVLGCTHYPYLILQIKKILPQSVTIIDSGQAVARQTKVVLEKNKLLNMSKDQPKYNFYTNSNVEILRMLLSDVQSELNVGRLEF